MLVGQANQLKKVLGATINIAIATEKEVKANVTSI